MKKLFIPVLAFTIMLSSCKILYPELFKNEKFNSQIWQDDYFGLDGKRYQMRKDLVNSVMEAEMPREDMLILLGTPNEKGVDFARDGSKIDYYYLSDTLLDIKFRVEYVNDKVTGWGY